MAFNIKDYVLPPGLREALDGAIHLRRPLLLTGEPGTGKTSLAEWAALELSERYRGNPDFGFRDEPLVFSTKTTSQARDLFYTYDALSHFQDANLKRDQTNNIDHYLELCALGRAIALSNPQPGVRELLPEADRNGGPRGCVVLIDEVDKAPRDFTNDVLMEIDRQRFQLREKNLSVERGGEVPIVVIMTSNSEKNLPDAFLRRCAFFHIEFPKAEDPLLRTIVEKHLGVASGATDLARQELLKFFYDARQTSPRKKPATAELLGWLELLELQNFAAQDETERKRLLNYNLSFLVKTQEDLEAVRKLIR